MATITIDIPEQQVAALTAKAKAQGLTIEDWFRQVAAKEAPVTSVAQLQRPTRRSGYGTLTTSSPALTRRPRCFLTRQ